MTRDEIIHMARTAGLQRIYGACAEAAGESSYEDWDYEIERFAELVAAAEREACAKVAEERFLDKANCTAEEMYELQKKSIAAAIRERGQK